MSLGGLAGGPGFELGLCVGAASHLFTVGELIPTATELDDLGLGFGWASSSSSEKLTGFGARHRNGFGFLLPLPWPFDFDERLFAFGAFAGVEVEELGDDGEELGANVPFGSSSELDVIEEF